MVVFEVLARLFELGRALALGVEVDLIRKRKEKSTTYFLDESMHLYKRLCLSVRPSVRPNSAKIAENRGNLIK